MNVIVGYLNQFDAYLASISGAEVIGLFLVIVFSLLAIERFCVLFFSKLKVLANKCALLLLSREARELGESFKSSGISGAEVVGRGTIIVDGKVIAQCKEFKELSKSLSNMKNKR